MGKLLKVIILVFTFLTLGGEAPPTETEQRFIETAGALRCPTCTGLSILDSEAAFSVQIKNQVREQIGQGKSKDEILKFFQDRYGPWILRAPPFAGVNAMAWVIPGVLLLLGPLLLFLRLVKKTSGDSASSSRVREVRTEQEILGEMRARIEVLRIQTSENRKGS